MNGHTHFSAMHALTSFLGVVIIGGVWRLSAGHLGRSANPTISNIGKTMLFQY